MSTNHQSRDPGNNMTPVVRAPAVGQKIQFEKKVVEVSDVTDSWVTYWVTKGRQLLSSSGASLDDWHRLVSIALDKGARYDDR